MIGLHLGTAWLFCPAHRPERFAKAWASQASVVILDLEDGTPAGVKTQARVQALDGLAASAAQEFCTVAALRINALRTRDGFDDLHAFMKAPGVPSEGVLLVPKMDSAGELAWLDAQLGYARPGWRICGLIESVRGLRCLAELINASPRLVALGFGAADFAAELGVPMDSPMIEHARHQFLLDSATRPLMRLDVPTLTLDDDQVLRSDCALARGLGFHGKFAIHPRQIAGISRAFAPTDAELQWAQRVVQAHEAAGGGAIQVDGQMIDEPLVVRARAWLSQGIP